MDLLEYVIALRGAAAAAAEVRGLAGEFDKLAVSQTRAGEAGAASGGKMAGAMGLLGKSAKVGALALVGVGVEAAVMSTKFNHEMLKIRTDAGASNAELANMKRGVLDLAASGQTMGAGPMSLAQGLYHLESLGQRGSKALMALKLAAQESAISGANLSDTTTAMGAAMYVGIKGTTSLTQLMGVLNATVGAGNMRFQDLTEALGTGLLSSAKVAGLSIQGINAALAVATDAGYKASSAGAQLGTALHFLYAPSSKAATALHNIGMTSTQMAVDLHKPDGLFVALKDLRSHLTGLSDVAKAQILNAILPGGRGRILLTELTMLDRLHNKYNQINMTAAGFTGSVSAQKRDPLTQLKTAEASLQANMIRLGNVLSPILIPALTAVARFASGAVSALTTIPHAIQDVITWFDNLGASGSVGTKQIMNAAGKMQTVGIAPPTGPIADFAQFVMKTFQGISKVASTVWDALSKAFSGIAAGAHKAFSGSFLKDVLTIGRAFLTFMGIVAKVVGFIVKTLLPGLVTSVRGVFNVIAGMVQFLAGIFTLNFGKMWDGLKQMFGGALKVIEGIVRNAFLVVMAPILWAFKTVIGAVGDAISFLWHNIFEPFLAFITAPLRAAWDLLNGNLAGAKQAFNDLISPINTVLGALKGLSDWVSSAGGAVGSFLSTITGAAQNSSSIGGGFTGGSIPAGNSPVLQGTSAGSATQGALTAPAHFGKNFARLHSAARAGTASVAPVVVAQHTGDIVVKVGQWEMARVMRSTLQEAQARGA